MVARFEHDVASGAVVLQVGWALTDARSGERIAARLQTFEPPVVSDGFAGFTDAMSRAVKDVATNVAPTLKAFESGAASSND